jgi:hypothetical protein
MKNYIYTHHIKMLKELICLILMYNMAGCFLTPVLLDSLKPLQCNHINIPTCNERTLYSKYLIGLRKTRRFLKNTTNINTIKNFTNEFVSNYTNIHVHIPNELTLNNTDSVIKTITMANVVLDVSTVQYIYISTKKDKIILELDKRDRNILDVLQNINNIDSVVSSILLLGKLLNISP